MSQHTKERCLNSFADVYTATGLPNGRSGNRFGRLRGDNQQKLSSTEGKSSYNLFIDTKNYQ